MRCWTACPLGVWSQTHCYGHLWLSFQDLDPTCRFERLFKQQDQDTTRVAIEPMMVESSVCWLPKRTPYFLKPSARIQNRKPAPQTSQTRSPERSLVGISITTRRCYGRWSRIYSTWDPQNAVIPRYSIHRIYNSTLKQTIALGVHVPNIHVLEIWFL